MLALNEIHNGESTHSQLHVIFPVNLRPINRTVNRPTKPIPPLEELLTGWLFKSIQLKFLKPGSLAVVDRISHDGFDARAG